MAGYIRLQELRTIASSGSQLLEDAVCVGDFNRLVVQVRTSVVADKGSRLYIQHAAVLDEDAFEDLCPGFWLSEAGSRCRTFQDPLRSLARRTGEWKPSVPDRHRRAAGVAMAHAYNVTTRASCLVGGKMYHTWTVEETSVEPTSEFSLDVPEFCTLTQYEAALISGTGTTINPAIGLAASWASSTLDQVATNVTAAAFICNRDRVSVTAVGGVLYFRSTPDSGTNNEVHTRITLVEGHC